MCLVNFSCRGKLLADSANCRRNLHTASEVRINLRNPLTFAESVYIRGIRNNYLYSLVDAEPETKSICRQNLPYSYLYAESTVIWNMFEDLSLESRNIQTQIVRLASAQFGLVILFRIFSKSLTFCSG